MSVENINWNDPKSPISKYFTVHEALWLPTWSRLASDSELTPEIKANIISTAATMDLVRDYLNVPINVHCWLRPPAYNKAIGGATASSHCLGMACDFDAKGINCDAARALLLPKLEELSLRMEQLPRSTWVHLDTRAPAPGGHRYFKP